MRNRGQERRKHERHEIERPVRIYQPGGDLLTRGNTLNISDGGVLISVPIDKVPQYQQDVDVKICRPGDEDDVHNSEEVTSRGCVVRHQPMEENITAGVAIRFEKPVELEKIVVKLLDIPQTGLIPHTSK